MKLNDTLDVISYDASSTSLDFVLNATKVDALATTEGKDLTLKAGSSVVGIWKGFTVTGVVDYESKSLDGGSKTYTRLTAARKLDPNTEAEISNLEANVNLVKQKSDESVQKVDGVSAAVESNTNDIADMKRYFTALVGEKSAENDESSE